MTDAAQPAKVCPWCAGKAYATSPSLGRSHWNVICDDCGASGPHGHDDEQAIRRWDDRYTDALAAAHPSPSHDALVEAAYHEGFGAARASLTEDEGYCLTADVEHDAWMDSEARAALAQGDRP